MDNFGPLIGGAEWGFILTAVIAVVVTAIVVVAVLLRQKRRQLPAPDPQPQAGLPHRLAELDAARAEGRISEDEYVALRAQTLDLR